MVQKLVKTQKKKKKKFWAKEIIYQKNWQLGFSSKIEVPQLKIWSASARLDLAQKLFN